MASSTFKAGQIARYKHGIRSAYRELWGKRVRVVEVLRGQTLAVQLLDEPGPGRCHFKRGHQYRTGSYKLEKCDGLLDI